MRNDVANGTVSKAHRFGHYSCFVPFVSVRGKLFGYVSAYFGAERMVKGLVIWVREETELWEQRLSEGGDPAGYSHYVCLTIDRGVT
jgi:hypothetical protein